MQRQLTKGFTMNGAYGAMIRKRNGVYQAWVGMEWKWRPRRKEAKAGGKSANHHHYILLSSSSPSPSRRSIFSLAPEGAFTRMEWNGMEFNGGYLHEIPYFPIVTKTKFFKNLKISPNTLPFFLSKKGGFRNTFLPTLPAFSHRTSTV